MSNLWVAFAIVLVLEGMLPFLSPKAWKKAVAAIANLQDKEIRIFGFALMLIGVILLNLIR